MSIYYRNIETLNLRKDAATYHDDADDIAANYAQFARTDSEAVSLFHHVRAVEKVLARAVSAYYAGDKRAVVEALVEAGKMECHYGDDTSTNGLALQLLEVVEA